MCLRISLFEVTNTWLVAVMSNCVSPGSDEGTHTHTASSKTSLRVRANGSTTQVSDQWRHFRVIFKAWVFLDLGFGFQSSGWMLFLLNYGGHVREGMFTGIYFQLLNVLAPGRIKKFKIKSII